MYNRLGVRGMNWKTMLLVVALVGAVGWGMYWWGRASGRPADVLLPTPTPAAEERLTVTVAPTATSTVSTISDEELIRQAIAAKHSKPVADTTVTVSKKTSLYAQGGVRFAGEVAGGWFLAAKRGGSWTIAADGNGTVNCSDIAAYDFPTDMVPECWDEAAGRLITR